MGRIDDAAALLGMRPPAAAVDASGASGGGGVTASWLRGLAAADVNKAFRSAALAAHPDKPDGDADKFRRATEARDALLRAVASAKANTYRPPPPPPTSRYTPPPSNTARASRYTDPTADSVGAAHGRPRAATTTASAKGGGPPPAAPPPFATPPAVAFAARLLNGTVYAFDASPAAFGSSGLKHGDVVRRVDPSNPGGAPAVGVIVGVASSGTVYWWRRGGGSSAQDVGAAGAATVFGKLSGPKAPTWSKVSGAGTPTTATCPPASRSSQPAPQPPAVPPPASSTPPRGAPSPPPPSPTVSTGTGGGSRGGGLAGLSSSLQRQEAEARTLFTSRVEAFYAQAAWVLQLPVYAAADRSYNAAYVAA